MSSRIAHSAGKEAFTAAAALLSICIIEAPALFAQTYPGKTEPPTPSNATARHPVAIDVDGDSKLDFIGIDTAGFNTQITVHINTGNGEFAAPIVTQSASAMSSLAAADFSGDGFPDLVFASGNFSVGYALGSASGTYGPFQSFGVAQSPVGTAIVDLNLDGKLDFVVCCRLGNSIFPLINDGAGSFYGSGNVASALFPGQVISADVNNDGKPDCLTANYGGSGSISTFLNAGAGLFFPSFTSSTLLNVQGLFAAQINGDGLADIVAIGPNSSTAVRLYNTGGGHFGSPSLFFAGDNDGAIYPALLDGDAHTDFVVTSTATSKLSSVRQLSPGVFTSTGFQANLGDIAIGDFDGDGWADLIGTNGGYVLVRNDSVGGFKLNSYFTNPLPIADFALRDMNGDGLVDALLACNSSAPSKVGIALNSGTDLRVPLSFTSVGGGGISLAVADFNHDGYDDAALTNTAPPYGASVVLSTGHGAFGTPTTVPGTGSSLVMHTCDLNGDGSPDLIQLASSHDLSAFIGNGAGAFAAPIQSTLPGDVDTFVTGDLDNDGFPDVIAIIAGVSGSSFRPAHNSGIGALIPSASAFGAGAPTLASSYGAIIADVNHDGIPDVSIRAAGTLVQFNGNGSGGFAQVASYSTLDAGVDLVFADVTRDGVPDAVGGTSTGFFVLPGLAAGGFAPAKPFSLAQGPGRLAVGDVSGDGREDIVENTSFTSGHSDLYVSYNDGFTVGGGTLYGVGTHGCYGKTIIASASKPSVGNASYGVYGTNAPFASLGLLLVTDVPSPAGGDPFGISVQIYVDLFASTQVYALNMPSDLGGAAFTPIPIPNNPALVGVAYFAQSLFIEPALERCTHGAVGLVSSNGLKFTIQ